MEYSGYDININKADVENRFDETCQGTVPGAFWIIRQSTSFEDAIRRAVSLGADADTLGAIVGGIAEARWGIPDDIRHKVMEYLPEEMKGVNKDLGIFRQFRKKDLGIFWQFREKDLGISVFLCIFVAEFHYAEGIGQ